MEDCATHNSCASPTRLHRTPHAARAHTDAPGDHWVAAPRRAVATPALFSRASLSRLNGSVPPQQPLAALLALLPGAVPSIVVVACPGLTKIGA